MADYFCTHCGCRHEPLAHVRHVTAREKLEKLAAWLAEDSDSDGTRSAETEGLRPLRTAKRGAKQSPKVQS